MVRDSQITRHFTGPRIFSRTAGTSCNESGIVPVASIIISTRAVSVFPEPFPPPIPITFVVEVWIDIALVEAGI